jgi:hypothetical protein
VSSAANASASAELLGPIAANFDDHRQFVATGGVARRTTKIFAGEFGAVVENRCERERVNVDATQLDHVVAATEHTHGPLQGPAERGASRFPRRQVVGVEADEGVDVVAIE